MNENKTNINWLRTIQSRPSVKGKKMRKKLILFDWGNIVESHTTGYTCYDAFNDLFKICGYDGNDNIFTSLGKYKLSSIPTVADFEDVYNQIANEYKFKTTYLEFIKLYKEIFKGGIKMSAVIVEKLINCKGTTQLSMMRLRKP